MTSAKEVVITFKPQLRRSECRYDDDDYCDADVDLVRNELVKWYTDRLSDLYLWVNCDRTLPAGRMVNVCAHEDKICITVDVEGVRAHELTDIYDMAMDPDDDGNYTIQWRDDEWLVVGHNSSYNVDIRFG
jgi:hypothetical protein